MTESYTLEEVKKHKTETDLWLVIKDNVYNVTKFFDQHPGGGEVLLDVAGKDASRDFEDVGHSPEAQEMMKEYLIGKLAPSGSTPVESKRVTTGNTSTAPKNSTTSSSNDKVKEEGSYFSYIAVGIIGIAALLYFFMGRKE